MLRGKIIDMLLKFSKRETTLQYRLLSLSFGAIFFLVIVPSILISVGQTVEKYIVINWHPLLGMSVAGIFIPLGIFFIIWTAITQWRLGKGTPMPNAPTKKLLIVGPYKLCRNPMVFGEISYYLGICTLFVSLTIGILSSLIALIVGCAYLKFIEEKELELRFGDEYIEYRKNTPFLIPRLWK